MGLRRAFCIGMLWGLLLAGCAGAKFGFKYYSLAAVSYDGTLLGPSPADDKSLKLCVPTEGNKAPCIVMFADEFLRLKQDYKDSKNRLKECEAGVSSIVEQ